MKLVKMQNVLSFSGLVFAIALTGCGRDKADAIKDYKALPYTNKTQVLTTSIDKTQVFRITCVTCEQNGTLPIFNDGEQGQLKLQLDILDPTIKSATLRMLPGTEIPGATVVPSPVAGENQIWYFKWRPNSVLRLGEQRKDFTLQLEARSVEVASIQKTSFLTTDKLTISVVPTHLVPQIEADTIPVSLNQGQSSEFTVTVFDPASSAQGKVPELNILPLKAGSNAENPMYNGSQLVKKLGVAGPDQNGAFTYKLSFSTADMRLPKETDGRSDGANLCFMANVTSTVTHNSSLEPRVYCIRVLFAVRAPFIKWTSVGQFGIQEVQAGVQQAVTFEIAAPNDTGSPTAATTASKKWLSEKDGDPKLVCDPSQDTAATKRKCTLSWIPSCKITKETKQSLTALLKNTYGNITKSSSDDTITLLVKPNPDGCVQKAASDAEAKASAKASAKQASAAAASAASASSPKAKTSKKKAPSKAKSPQAPASAASNSAGVNS